MASELPKTMKAAVLTGVGKPLEIQDIPLPEMGAGEILIKVYACGVCHSDSNVAAGDFGPPAISILGHEFIGTVVAVPPTEKKWVVGDRVGGPWHGGHDGTCRSCSRGQFQMCDNKTVNGVFRNGGYGEYATLRTESAVRISKEMDPAETAPLLCAGVTVFNGIRKMGIIGGETVAIQGLGGLGHLAIQYARKMGFRTVALSRGTDKKDFAMQLGATDYIDTSSQNVAEALQTLGGAALVVVTAPNPEVISPLIGGLQPGGKLLLHTAIGPVQVDTVAMVLNALSVHGWPSGHALDSEEAIAFAKIHGVKCLVEKFPLEKANEAMEHMLSGKARFRAVLTMG
ncbi:alcohol dehydrogenase like protein [Zymoseptoria brevis]|uniref:Alcohol dehydrogenase like protein n=1 Tax=Zymoseptoria brevis TaxID=1047168 RepID=A0A0F4GAM4_9PEZI|nr:alcohol dehydrogenase like protein [Zymoseptoria brevis]